MTTLWAYGIIGAAVLYAMNAKKGGAGGTAASSGGGAPTPPRRAPVPVPSQTGSVPSGQQVLGAGPAGSSAPAHESHSTATVVSRGERMSPPPEDNPPFWGNEYVEDVVGPVWSDGAPLAAPWQDWWNPEPEPVTSEEAAVASATAAEVAVLTALAGAPQAPAYQEPQTESSWWTDSGPFSFPSFDLGPIFTDAQPPPAEPAVHTMAGSYGTFDEGAPPAVPEWDDAWWSTYAPQPEDTSVPYTETGWAGF